MSLLMDALKRAEKEREAAKPDKDKPATEDGLSLEPKEESAPAAPASNKEQAPKAPDFTLEARDDELPQTERDLTAEPPVLDEEDKRVPSGLEGIPLDDVGPKVSMEETAATMPSMKAVKASVDRYFDGSASTSMTMDSVRREPGVGEGTTVSRERTIHTQEQPPRAQEQQAAQAVFDAKALPKRRVAWGWLAGVPLLLILLGVGAYYFWTLLYTGSPYTSPTVATPRPVTPAPTQPSQTADVAEAQPAPAPPAVAPGLADAATTGAPPPSQATSPEVAVAPTVAEMPAVGAKSADAEGSAVVAEDSLMEAFLLAQQEPPSSGDLTPALEPPPQPAAQQPPARPSSAPSDEDLGWLSDEEFQAALSRSSAAVPASMRSEAITIRRGQSTAPTVPLLASAYGAYQEGDLARAETAYRKVLAQDSRNRDAWLGLGAIAVQAKRWGSATEIYLRLLGLNPRDSVAQAALIALQQNLDPVQGESVVKTALEQEPDAPYLHFTLGNLYANQGRWAEAQNAYFDAYRLDSQNPDYAFNLAVGLEHLSQGRTALEYYSKAVELARTQKSNFDLMVAQQRIDTLSKRPGAN